MSQGKRVPPGIAGLLRDSINYLIRDEGLVKAWLLITLLFGALTTLFAGTYQAIMDRFGLARELTERSIERMEELSRLASVVPLPLLILGNNAVVATIEALSSITIVAPIIIIAFNSWILGSLVGSILSGGELIDGLEGPIAALTTFMSLAPHGVVEVPAMTLVAASVAKLRLGPKSVLKTALKLLPVSLLMLLIAAIVESALIIIAWSLG